MEWINAKDKLPDFNTPVIVNSEGFAEEGYYPLMMATLVKIVIDETGKHLEWNDYQNIGLVEVTHWMSFPEPPKNPNK